MKHYQGNIICNRVETKGCVCGLIIGLRWTAFTVFTKNYFKKPTFFVPQSESLSNLCQGEGQIEKKPTSCQSYSLLRYYVENKDNFRLNINIMLQMYSNVTKTRWAHSTNTISTWGRHIRANLGCCSGRIADPGRVCRPCRERFKRTPQQTPPVQSSHSAHPTA